ncbi:securin [Clupea harengus]|uniref:Securin n=1 Tax=Clupea harengus TaxID=7950 RepID=A0A8M1KNC0_CLUHA|nr:securin [Clupea harengus]XP_042563878.1 securin [Clupea harengus]
MSALMFAGQENVRLRLPPGKDRMRLKSAPELNTEKGFKTPGPTTPLLNRPRLCSQKVTHTPNVYPQREDPDLRCRVKDAQPPAEDAEPDIERMFPYRPDDFERYGVTDGVLYLSALPLAGAPWLPWHPVIPEADDITLEACEPLPPPHTEEHREVLDDFLLTLSELMVDLPPPPEDDDLDL